MPRGRLRAFCRWSTTTTLFATSGLSSCSDDVAIHSAADEIVMRPPAFGAAPAAPDPLRCLGTEAPVTLLGARPYAKVKVGAGAEEGTFLLDFATTSSTIDLSKFVPPGPAASGCDPTKLRERCTFAGFDFFGPWGTVSLVTANHSGANELQAGIIGTDFLSTSAIAIDFAQAKIWRAREGALCSDDALAAAGFSPLSSAGFYSNSHANLRPLTEVRADATPSRTVPNVPTVPVRVAGVSVPTQLDTGFDDGRVPFSVNINEALLTEIQSKAPQAIVRAEDKDLSLSTCAGVRERVDAYTLAPGVSVDFLSELGAATKSFPSAVLFVKHPPSAAKKCGGIGTWTAPAAQVGASFFAAFGTLVFDPFTSRVWVK